MRGIAAPIGSSRVELFAGPVLNQPAMAMRQTAITVRQTVRDLLDDPERLRALRQRNAELAHPEAAQRIAALMCALADKHRDASTRPEPYAKSAVAANP